MKIQAAFQSAGQVQHVADLVSAQLVRYRTRLLLESNQLRQDIPSLGMQRAKSSQHLAKHLARNSDWQKELDQLNVNPNLFGAIGLSKRADCI